MKKYLLTTIFTLILTSLSIVILGQDITLKQTNKTGIYTKGQKIIVKAFSVKQTGDTLHVSIFKNNNQLILHKDFVIGKDSMQIYDGVCGDPCSIIVEAKSKAGNASLGMLVDPEL